MAIERQTILDQIEITRDGTVQVRLGLLLVEDGQEIDCKWHRTAIPPGVSVQDQIGAVNAHLAQMSKDALSSDDIQTITAYANLAHTPEKVGAYKARVASRDAS